MGPGGGGGAPNIVGGGKLPVGVMGGRTLTGRMFFESEETPR